MADIFCHKAPLPPGPRAAFRQHASLVLHLLMMNHRIKDKPDYRHHDRDHFQRGRQDSQRDMIDVSELDPIIHDRLRGGETHNYKEDTQRTEEEQWPVVAQDLNDRKKYFGAIGYGTKLGDAAGRAIAIFDRKLHNSETFVEGMQSHVGLDLKPLDQNRIVLDKSAGESSIAAGDIDQVGPKQDVDSPL